MVVAARQVWQRGGHIHSVCAVQEVCGPLGSCSWGPAWRAMGVAEAVEAAGRSLQLWVAFRDLCPSAHVS